MSVKAWNRHDKELAALTKMASQDLVTLINKYPSAGVEDIQLFMKGLSDKYGKQAAASAFQAIRNSREAYDLWDLLELPVVMDPATAEQVHAATAWALQTKKIPGGASGAESLHRLVGVLVRLVNQPARDTVRESAVRAGVAWARVPTAKACAFCLMLASRGAVYESKAVALAASGDRGPQSEGSSYHDNCHCRAIESYSDADLPQIVRDLQDEWYEVTEKAVRSGEKQQAAWNRHVKESRPTGSARRPRNEAVFPKGKPMLTERNWRHILDGEPDGSGKGGHRFGTNQLGKTEFPKTWSDDKIKAAVEETLDQPQWSQMERKTARLRRVVDGVAVEVRVNVGSRRRAPQLVTAYPKGGRNVYRVDRSPNGIKRTPMPIEDSLFEG